MNQKKKRNVFQVFAGIDHDPYLLDPVVLDGNDIAEARGSNIPKAACFISFNSFRSTVTNKF